MHYTLIFAGGIGGLSARRSSSASVASKAVYEAAPALSAVDARIALPPNAMQVPARLGLGAALEARPHRRSQRKDSAEQRS